MKLAYVNIDIFGIIQINHVIYVKMELQLDVVQQEHIIALLINIVKQIVRALMIHLQSESIKLRSTNVNVILCSDGVLS